MKSTQLIIYLLFLNDYNFNAWYSMHLYLIKVDLYFVLLLIESNLFNNLI